MLRIAARSSMLSLKFLTFHTSWVIVIFWISYCKVDIIACCAFRVDEEILTVRNDGSTSFAQAAQTNVVICGDALDEDQKKMKDRRLEQKDLHDSLREKKVAVHFLFARAAFL